MDIPAARELTAAGHRSPAPPRSAAASATLRRWEASGLWVDVLADPARVSRRTTAALDEAIGSLVVEADSRRITRVAAAALPLDRVVECREPLRRAVDGSRNGRSDAVAVTAAGLLCAGDVATGRWDEAAALAKWGIALCAQHGNRSFATPLRLAQALMTAARGDDVRTRSLVDAAPGRPGGVHTGDGRRVLALAALGRGDAETSYRHATAVTPPGRLVAGTAALQVSPDLVEAAVRLGRRAEARRHVQAMREAPVHAASARFAMLTAASTALVAEPEDAEACFAAALSVPDAERWPFDHARIQLACGEHLRRQRRLGPSRMLLDAALDTFERLGALPWTARARRGLRATGLTIGCPVAPQATDLTPDERTAAALAAAGLTNKQIARRLMVSHHTVAARLYRAFPKLGVGSRAALRNAMSTLDGAAGRSGEVRTA